jgi:hypothetical protein
MYQASRIFTCRPIPRHWSDARFWYRKIPLNLISQDQSVNERTLTEIGTAKHVALYCKLTSVFLIQEVCWDSQQLLNLAGKSWKHHHWSWYWWGVYIKGHISFDVDNTAEDDNCCQNHPIRNWEDHDRSWQRECSGKCHAIWLFYWRTSVLAHGMQ